MTKWYKTMTRFEFSKSLHPLGVLFLGLLTAQVLATIQVYLSNVNLHAVMTAVNSAGYLAIPNQKVARHLLNFTPAFLGGLFFTFSIGAGISLVTMAAAWAWERFFKGNRRVFWIFMSTWGGLLVLINIGGFNLAGTLYFLVIPPVVFCALIKFGTVPEGQPHRLQRMIHLIPVPLMAILWFTQFDGSIFIDLRDHLLLSSAPGRMFNRFYYDYTLYPAEAFKSRDQKIIRTCKLENIPERSALLRLEKRLLDHDYLPLDTDIRVDLTITQKNGMLQFKANGRTLFDTPVDQFLSDTKDVLHKFSAQSDRFMMLRQLTFLSLLIGFPISLYLFFHALFYYFFLFFTNPKSSALIASIMCFLLGFIVLVYFQSSRSPKSQTQHIAADLQSADWQKRVAALKTVLKDGLEISAYPAYPWLLNSQLPQERYWFVRTLAVSRSPRTYDDLKTFLADPNANVRSMAFDALGQRKNPAAIRTILERIDTSNDWYSQLYAYRALRSLGWKQTKSQ